MQEDIPKLIIGFERKIKAQGWSVNQFCRKAGVEPFSWRRWRAGLFRPRAESLERIRSALADIKADPASTPRVKPKTKPRTKKAGHKFEEAKA